MPAMYAHYLLGRETIPFFDSRVKEIVNAYRDLFDVGLQGPDFYFFDQMKYLRGKTFAKIGRQLHNEPCMKLINYFERIGIAKLDQANLAYIFGLIGHFSLDSTCHPYIDSWVKTLPYNHMRMETEFDRYLLERDGYDPRRFPLGNCILTEKSARFHIGYMYEGYGSAKDVASLIHEYSMIKNAMRTPYNGQYYLYQGILSAVRIRKYIGGVFMGPQDEMSNITNPRLDTLFKEAQTRFITLTNNYMAHYLYGTPLDEYFLRDFEVLPRGQVLDNWDEKKRR